MELENRIRKILQMDKFGDLSEKEKELVFQSILANCLILSKENQEKFLSILENRLVEIVNLKDSKYQIGKQCYDGIVESTISRQSLDPEQDIFPYKYYLKYREYSIPLGQMTKSILHEFGHLASNKECLNLSDNTLLIGNVLLIDIGGLVITKEKFGNEYGNMIKEILNEFTTLISYKAFLAYHTPNEESERKMREYAEKMGLSIDEFCEWLKVLPDDLFSNFAEVDLTTNTLEDGTERMFNPLYVKYTPLVRLMMFAFQNPLFSYNDLKREFEKGNGLDAKINGIPINDLFCGYYGSAFHTQELFDSILGEQGAWEKFCVEFDSKMMDRQVDDNFIASSIELFTKFYQARLKAMIESGLLTSEQAAKKAEEFQQIVSNCMSYYDSIER